MTDNEIISIDEAIIHCYETYYERDDLCREYRDEHKQLAKWLEELKERRETINHQKAEIERLEEMFDSSVSSERNVVDNIGYKKSEAIKEFAERLCNGRVENDPVVIATKAELDYVLGVGLEVQK